MKRKSSSSPFARFGLFAAISAGALWLGCSGGSGHGAACLADRLWFAGGQPHVAPLAPRAVVIDERSDWFVA